MSEQVAVGDAVVDALESEGVRTVFGLPGGHVLGIYDGLYRSRSVRHVLVRHENAAASMAAGYAQLTGEVGVCLVTAGPGATNLLTGIAEAYVGALPVLVLAGRASTATAHRGAQQEVPTERIFDPVTKMSVRVDRADLLTDHIRQGFSVARSGKPGPVYLDIPRDLLNEQIARRPYLPAGPAARPAPDDEAVTAMAAALTSASAPLLIAGGGTRSSGAFAELAELAEMLNAPVLTSLSGRGCIPDDHPLSAGGLGAHRNPLSARLLCQADVILNLGCRFEEMETNWRAGYVPSPGSFHIQVDIDQAELGRSVPTQLGVVGDIRQTIRRLIPMLRDTGTGGLTTARDRYQEEISGLDHWLDSVAGTAAAPLHPLAAIRAARRVFPRDATVAIDVGCSAQQIAGSFPSFRVYQHRSTIMPSSFYGMGFSSAALPVARLVYPDRPAVGFAGDGSFQMIMNVLPVAREHRLGVTWCILNDNALSSIWDAQHYAYGKRYIGTEFTFQPDFAMLAASCGCHGERVEKADDLESALQRALQANSEGVPAVVDIAISRERMPQTLDHYTYYQAARISPEADA